MSRNLLTIALPKGKLLEDSVSLLVRAGINCGEIDEVTFELKISRYRLEKALRQLQSGAAVKRCFPAAKG